MYKYLKTNLISYKKPIKNGTIKSLGLQWTKKYLLNSNIDFYHTKPSKTKDFNQAMSQVPRKITTQKQLALMLNVSLQAWKKTAKFLSKEVKRYLIKSELIDSWKFAGDSLKIDKNALDFYQKQASKPKPSMVINLVLKQELLPSTISPTYSEKLAHNEPQKAITFVLATLKQKHTQQYLRLIGFVSMQFKYIGKILLSLLSNYFKVIHYLSLPLPCF